MDVIKIGGSILRDAASYARVAERLATWPRPVTVVLSAAHGVTDRLAGGEEASGLVAYHLGLAAAPLPRALWRRLEAADVAAQHGHTAERLAWGELASCEVLRTHLALLGRWPPIAELGRPLPRQVYLTIVPGFYRRDRAGIAVLPRGGSDISAVDVATQLEAQEVTYWKGEGGIRMDGVVVERVPHAALQTWIGKEIRPLHGEAVRRAAAAGIRLRLEDPWGVHPATVVA